MKSRVTVACSCGRFRATAHDVAANSGNHVVCYCDDCQLFQHYLGKAEEVLDEHGGTHIFQISPATFEPTHGLEQLACLRLRPGGIVRWYARCCSTPLGNTLATPKVPFFGMIRTSTQAVDGGGDVEAATGPVLCGVYGTYATGRPEGFRVYDTAPLWLLLRFMRKMLRWRFRGDGKRSPFFDAESGRLRVRPKVLREEELAAAIGRLETAAELRAQ